MKRKNMARNALVTSLISLLLCVSMLVGTTFAWFTDTVTTTNNTITAGNLDIDLEYKKGVNDAWTTVTSTSELFDDAALWEPGHTEVVYLKIINKGTLALNYQIGLNALNETPGTNVAGEQFFLSKYIKFDVTDGTDYTRQTASAAAENGTSIYDTFEHPLYETGSLVSGATKEMALVVCMPETVGNEANYRGNAAPYIKLGLNLVASQMAYESDSFGSDYDGETNEGTMPQSGTGSVAAPAEGVSAVEVTVRNASTNAKVATLNFPAASIAEDAENIVVTVTPIAQDSTVTVTDEQDAQSFDIKVEGLKEGNTELVTVRLRVGTGLSGVKVYHKNQLIEDAVYDNNGYVVFQVASFSPFTVVYDAEYQKPDIDEDSKATATVNHYGAETANAEIEKDGWKAYDNWKVSNNDQRLEDAFIFIADEKTAENSPYKDWLCDFYVSMDRNVPVGSVCLAGNYASYGWIGFENTSDAIGAGEEIALLATAVGRETANWTYADVISLVGEFKCGVARTIGTDYSTLAGATLTVALRMSDPTGAQKPIDVAVVKYTFGNEFGTGTYTISN